MSEHVEEAKEWLRDAPVEQHGGNVERAMLCVGMAQAEATLAVAEQLRIGNIVALGALQIASSMDGYNTLVGDGGAFRALYPGGSNTPLRPDIARALGLEVSDE